ncbi:methyltransferase domain-containing protein [Nocardiopsis synnemataformans]|uniref:methyltransferase domain-containing protein n=1 Tax=Nocardiopsis synnemataformans TaxID=61305 RepID=UPI003EBB0D29
MNLEELHTRLVGRLDTTDAIRAAFADHPRHRYIPDLVWPDIQGLPLVRSADPARWAAYVYDDDAVVTQANDGGSGAVNTPSSSSSAPQVMVEMIQAAEVCPGMRVLEIGTGTGWNAAILSSLVGPTGGVTSLEIDPKVAERARKRLAGTGVEVRTDVTPPEGTYDAVIATCSAHRVPEDWTRHLTAGGRLILPWAPYEAGGPTPIASLVGGREGRFVRDGSFMRDRGQRVPAQRFPGMGQEVERKGSFPLGSRELLDQDLLTRLVLAAPDIGINVGVRPWESGTASIIALGAGAPWAYVWPDGSTTGGGPRDLVEELAEVHALLEGAGWPELSEFSLETDTECGVYRVRTGALGPWEHPV